MTRALVLAGTHSGCGKTSVTLGLLRALARRGLAVQPFKTGPDFIDPGLHARAAGRASHNLDTWMQPEAAVRGIFSRCARGAQAAVVEGAMGLFDGRSGTDEAGSTAHLAKVLGLPVLLVIDAASQARSVAALVQGFARFDPDLPLAGVILNRVASKRHETLLREALAQLPGLPVLGCLPRREGLGLASRHLGLVTAEDAPALEETLDALARWVEQGMDLPALLNFLPEAVLPELSEPELCASALPEKLRPATVRPGPVTSGAGLPVAAGSAAPSGLSSRSFEARAAASPAVFPRSRVRIAVARDRAFCFTYAENLRLLEAAGAQLAFFSPLADAALPEGPDGLDGLLLPGGYPELAAAELSANAAMRAAVRAFCASGRPVWAECGGYMYLLEELADLEGRAWPMCGALPGRAAMRAGRTALGYREARTLAAGPLGPAGTLLRGHEFRYSEYVGDGVGREAFSLKASDGSERADGQRAGNVLAGYFHAHLASNPEAARAFVAACRAARKE